jgi:hypothetical protein
VSLYDALGTSSDATAEELRRAFVAQARRFHPDRHVGADAKVRRDAEQRMREVTEAWAVLGDPERRRFYDLGLGDPVARGGRGSVPDSSRPGQPGPTKSSTSAASPVSSEGRPWRSYASPGPGGGSRSAAEQLLLLSPVLFLGVAGLFGMAGAIVGWPPFYGVALVCVIVAAAAFFMLPIWAMTRGRVGGDRRGRGGRGPKRSY